MKNSTLYARAQSSIPGGVNSPVRSFRSVGGDPVFIKKANGAYLYDEEDRKYIDYINSWGPMILGHAYEPLVKAISEKAKDSTSFGAPTLLEIEVAELIKAMAPNIDLVRMVNSGTEACMSALRLARGFTGRNKFIKFEGCYHGHADSFLVKAGSGVATLDIQAVPGVTEGVAMDTLTAPYNDLEAVQALVDGHNDKIAAIIIEPVAGNMGCILPEKGFIEGLRNLCTKKGIVLIFDEVMTGFRLAPGGAQEKLGIDADLITYGKVIGGGLPVGAFGGKKEIMSHIAPLGKVYQAGTLSGNPIAMAAGFTLLKTLYENPSVYDELEQKGTMLEDGLHRVLQERGFSSSAEQHRKEKSKDGSTSDNSKNRNYCINRMGSMISLHFGALRVTNFAQAAAADNTRFNRFFHAMLQHGVYLPPSAFETWFLSNALTKTDIDHTLEAAWESLPASDPGD